ncbi:hypothetical protein BDFB_013437, partial [Asbolus verrucosus]
MLGGQKFNSFADKYKLKTTIKIYDEQTDWLVPNDTLVMEEANRIEMGRSIDIEANDEDLDRFHEKSVSWQKFSENNHVSCFKNSIPKPSELLLNIGWPPVSVQNGHFLYVDINESLTVKNHPKEETYKEGIELYDSLNYDDEINSLSPASARL